jgi:hypothetical protein
MFLLTIASTIGVALPQDSGRAYAGRERQLDVAIPRLEAAVTVDGVLDETVWAQAARLGAFSQYQPVDGRPAEEPTEVLVWYSATAIHFGIRAREVHGDVVRATRADRDAIGSDDHVQILLDTYDDRRIAFLFGVNPFGVQQDGTRSDNFSGGAGGRSGGGGGVGINPLEGNVDLNPDYVFESRGRLVAGGYEVEVRIPFKSLRYQDRAEQSWGIQVLRRVQHSGFQDAWTPAVRASASFLGQAGRLTGLHDLHRGLVLELTPVATQRVDGAPDTGGAWTYSGQPELGGDVRWGITQNLSLNGTVNPDFSQVEADVGQVLVNERFALFYPEKRPFFLDGLELFDTPNTLIHTRQVEELDVGVKLAGKTGATTVAAMLAVEPDSFSATASRPLAGMLRLRRDIGRNSSFGLVGTAHEDGSDFSRLAGADLRLYHSRLYFVELQAVQSWTETGGGAVSGPLMEVTWDRTGRSWGFNYGARAVAPDFQARLGFVNRTNVVDAHLYNRLTGYGAQDALVQTYGAFFIWQRLWRYDDLDAGTIEGSEGISPSMTLRGGWQPSGNVSRSFFGFDPADYATYTVEVPAPPGTDTVAFSVPGMLTDLWSGTLRVTTPTWRRLTASASVSAGATPIFAEAVRGTYLSLSATVDLRPTEQLRVALQYTQLGIERSRDGSRFSREAIPRLKVEYQLSRAVFVRFVGQYTARERDALYDGAGNPILVNGVAAGALTANDLRTDLLFSYRPTPGTLFYLGYGASMTEPEAFGFDREQLRRTSDGFFAKASYLFRI